MEKVSAPAYEEARLASLRDLVVLDSAPEPLFDSIARMASEVCGVPIALISLVDAERQWFKANVGLPGVNETPRDIAFCAHAIGSDAVFEVPDATLDPRFAHNPLVTGPTDIQFYAGAPLILPDGQRVGTLCVIDHEARNLDAGQTQTLRSLAIMVSQALVMRRDLINKSIAVRSEYERLVTEREIRYRAIVEEQTELISLAEVNGKLIYVNPAYARHFGRTPAQMVGTNLFDFIEPSDHDLVKHQFDAVLRGGQSLSHENRMVAIDGSDKWVAWTNSPQCDDQGKPLLHSVGRDVTERKRVELALRESQSFLYRTGRVAGVGGWEVDVVSGDIHWSEETRRIHEVGPDYVPTLEEALKFYAPQARPIIENAVKIAMQNGQPWDLELPFITATGRHIWVRAVGEVEFEHGTPVRLVGAFQDITEHTLLKQRVADSERFVRLITDNLPLGIAYVDKDFRYQFVNLTHCQRFGRDREEIIGRTRSELTGVASDAPVNRHIDAVLAGQMQRFEHEESVQGKLCRFEIQLVPDVSPTGEVRGFFASDVDITERSATDRALRELTAILENTTDYVVQTNWSGQITYMNPAVRQAVGVADESMENRTFAEFNTPVTNQLFLEIVLPAVRTQGVWVGETTVVIAQQREIPVSHMVIAHRAPNGRIERFSAVMRDISAQTEAKRQLQLQAAVLRSVTEAIPAIVAVVGADGRYRFVNSSFERWYRVERDHVIGRTMPEVLSPADYEVCKPWVSRALAGDVVNFERTFTGRSSFQHMALSYIPLRLGDGTVDGFVGVAQDITPHKQEELRLLGLTQRDALTGLLNRAGFEEYLERQITQGGRASIALLYIDLDHFKPVNDQYGHPVGDQVLQMFAHRLMKLVRPTDAVARLGGDEFAVVLSGVRESANAHLVADKIVDAAHTLFGVGALQLQIGASVGVAFGIDPGTSWRDLVARADVLLYQAKAAGRGRHAGST